MRSHKGPHRLPYGGQVDRTRRIFFRFDGRDYPGHPGDTLASALLANGVRTVARSFKLHRPRGIYSCGIEEPNALVQLGSGARVAPSIRAPVIELHDGLESRSQEGWPSVRFDVGRVLDLCSPLWAAGFYNKTFIWPNWHTYEPVIRKMAGLGRTPGERDPDRYDIRNLHCEVLVVGGGRAGLVAAEEAGRAGGRVVLVEQDRILGGKAAWDNEVIHRKPPDEWVRESSVELARRPHVRILTRTTAVACYDHNVVMLVERLGAEVVGAASPRIPRERLWIVRTKRIVLATGAIEQPLIFCHNDRPGILLAGAARQYLRRYGVAPGSQILIATNNDSAYPLAMDLKDAGVSVIAVVDTRDRRDIPEVQKALLRRQFIDLFPGSIPTNTSGFGALKKVTVGRLSTDARQADVLQTFRCDALAVSGGSAPALQLFAQVGGKLAYDDASGALHPVAAHPFIEIVGSAAQKVPVGPRISPVGPSHRQWVDLAHDVTVADLELALRENYTGIEHVKRYTTVGMAIDQGKTSHAASLEIVSKLRSVSTEALGYTTLRPPVTPVSLGAIAGCEVGEYFAPTRHLPMHEWHVKNGAVMQEFGAWQRAVAYLRRGETREQAAHREALAVRTGAGLFDGSSLGKIEVRGADALEFLDRFYINNLKTLQPGRVRYGLMLRETGVIFDDGTVVALTPDHLLITTTSGNAARVYQWLEEWRQCEWRDLEVAVTAVTEQWATMSLAGPLARKILSRLDTDIDLSSEGFPHLAMREGKLLGLPARIYRVSFTGELTYEINVPSDAGPRLWEALLEAGAFHRITPFGMDALMTLRLEKGFLHVGTDTDGSTVPDDVGWGRVASGKVQDFIGKRSLALPEHLKPDRLQLVGLKAVATGAGRKSVSRDVAPISHNATSDFESLGIRALYTSALSLGTVAGTNPFVVGSHLRLKGSTEVTDGWITSAGMTVFGGVPIALALLRGGRERVGAEVAVFDEARAVGHAQVMEPPFYNAGERMHA